MVSGIRVKQIGLDIILRSLFLLAALFAAAYAPSINSYFLEYSLDYQRSGGFFGFSIENVIIELIFSFILWASILFGAIGKKIDYLLIVSFIILAVIAFYNSSASLNIKMYLGLIGVALLGNAIGYMLKLARLRWLHK